MAHKGPDLAAPAQGIEPVMAETGETAKPRTSMKALLPLLPYVARHKGWIAAALTARCGAIGYAYGTKGIGSVINNFTNEKFLADNKGHTVVLGYAMADNFHLGFRWMSLQEKELIDTSAGANQGLAYGGTTASQKMKTNYWELNAGVAF